MPGGMHSKDEMKSSTSRSRRRHGRLGKLERVFPLAVEMPNMRVAEGLANQVFTHIATVTFSAYQSTSAAVATFGNHALTQANVPDFASWAAVFDQFRFIRAQAWVVPRASPGASNTANLGMLCSVVDYDDQANLANFAAGTEYQNALTAPGGMGHYRDWVPHVAVATYGGAFTQFGNLTSPWIDCAANPFWYALKTVATATDIVYVYDLIVRTTVEFRNSR